MIDVAAVTAILDYLNTQNRPYSAIDILNNLHKEYGKVVNYVYCSSILLFSVLTQQSLNYWFYMTASCHTVVKTPQIDTALHFSHFLPPSNLAQYLISNN